LAWLLIIGNVERSENKDPILRVMLFQTFGVIPVVAIIVGAFVGSLVPRSGWWLGGVTLLPLFIYGLVRGASGVEVLLAVQLLLALGAAFVVSRFKRPNPV
jgi:hypothetical protein